MNFIRNKFEFLVTQVKSKIDFLMISETRLKSFSKESFSIEGFTTPYSLDHDSKCEEIMVYVRDDILSNFFAFELLKINPSKTFLLSLTCKIPTTAFPTTLIFLK